MDSIIEKYLTEASAEEIAKRNISKKIKQLHNNLKQLESLMKKQEFDKAMSFYNTDVKFNTRGLGTYLSVLSKRN